MRWFATGSLTERVSFKVRGVLHGAGRYLADVGASPQLLLLTLGEGESLCVHILITYLVYEENRTGVFTCTVFGG